MIRVAAVLVCLLAFAACTSSLGTSTAPPTATAPGTAPTTTPATTTATAKASLAPASPACGGFHLLIDNQTPAKIIVSINGAEVTRVEPTKQTEIVQFFWQPQLPLLPWDVQISRAGDGVQLTSRHFEDADQGARMVVTDQNADVALGPCGKFG